MKCSDRVVLLGYTKVLPKEHFCVSVKPPSGVREVIRYTQPKQLWSALLCKGFLRSRYFGFNPQDTVALTHTLIFLLTFAATTVQTTSGALEVRHFPAYQTSWTTAPGSSFHQLIFQSWEVPSMMKLSCFMNNKYVLVFFNKQLSTLVIQQNSNFGKILFSTPLFTWTGGARLKSSLSCRWWHCPVTGDVVWDEKKNHSKQILVFCSWN